MKDLKFIDEFVESQLDKIANLNIDRHVINADQIEVIRNSLKLDNMSIDELRVIRNSVVKLFGEKEDKYYEYGKKTKSYEEFDKYHNAMSGTVAVIDHIIWKKGGEL